ncbi:DedA family protein [Thermostaphylospora chromogena]|uniref:Membrane protein DedA, SNARE-associated domain n=1 Tax=Thermostaphylospora chromogena TaxID=35622 RepID=A0A1H1BRB8_9ACTN|nr:DedA family protein [Thermostaphylospora chromogena]SDQ54524.1 membrane protein DedA, SNARE-associated domain [Thermostaphylospora chromogena]
MDWITEWIRAVGDLPLPLTAVVAWSLAFAESGIGLGSVFPGETSVLLLSATATGPVRFAVVLLTVAAGVTTGDHVGYCLGRRYGERLRSTRVVGRLGVRNWDRAMDALRRHGAAAVFATRLVPVVRTLTPAAAGASRVSYGRFLPASLAGSLTWSAVYVSLGAFAGASAVQLEQRIGQAAWLVFGLGAVLIAGVVVLRRRRASRRAAGDRSRNLREPLSGSGAEPDDRDRGHDGPEQGSDRETPL